MLPTLYKRSKKDKILIWKVNISDDCLIIEHGYQDGKIRSDTRQIKTNKSGRTLYEQLLLEAKSKYNKKIDEGYSTDINTSFNIPEPMLAYELKNDLKFPIIVQVKLDGIRALCKNDILYTRKKKSLIYTDGHFKKLREEINRLRKKLPDNIILDGELYNHELSFNEITSIVRTQKKIHPNENLIQYFIFDFIDYDKPFTDRFNILKDAFNEDFEYLELVEYNVADNYDDIYFYHNEYVNAGFEGLIARECDGKYISGRTYNLMKYKMFYEDEGEIIDIREGEGSEKGLALFTIKDKNNRIFNARPQGTFELRKKWFEDSNYIKGKIVTYKYFELSKDGIPRFPVVKCLRDYEN